MKKIEDQKIIKWLQWIDEIQNETQSLLIKTNLYDMYVGIVSKNPEIQNPRDFHDWAMHNYFDSALMGIRRLVKVQRRDGKIENISLRGLLEELKENPEIITQEFYLRDYKEGQEDESSLPDSHAWTHAVGRDFFKKRFANGGEVLQASIVEQDIQELEAQTKIVEDFIDNTLAHRNKGAKGKQILQTKDARQAIDVIEKIAIKYIDLLGRGSFGQLTPIYQYNPESVFLKPWIESGME